MWFFRAALATAAASVVQANFVPAAVYSVSAETGRSETSLPAALESAGQTVFIDYGFEVAGTPYFVVHSIDQPVQLEFRYSEEFAGLNNAFGDGPFPFSAGLSGTFRTETFNVTSAGTYQSYFIQGGQRWQSISQITEGSLVLSEVGLVPSVEIPDLSDLPSKFACSNPAYNEIWKLGALASSAGCLEAHSQRSTWDITSEGALIRGQKPALSAYGLEFADYTISFKTKIIRGSTGWAIAQSTFGSGLQLLLTSDMPESSTFLNTNTSIIPPNSLLLAFGFSFVNQTTLESYYLDHVELPTTIIEGAWYEIETTLSNGTDLVVSVNGTTALNVSLSEYGITLGDSFNPTASFGRGSWGFAPWQDHIALYTDVVVTAINGTQLYENSLTEIATLAEYGVGENNGTFCLDGPKRDRLVWLGDAFHTTQIIPYSTSRKDHVQGTLQYLLGWQNEEGLMPIAPPIGTDPIYAPQVGGYGGLQDYQTLGLLGYTGYFKTTGDLEFAQELWPGFQKQISWLISQINSTTGLLDIGGFTGPAVGTATSSQLVQALNEAALVAKAVNETALASSYTETAANLADAIATTLWNETLGVYTTSLGDSNFSVAGIAFAITSGIATSNSTRLTALLTALDTLALGPGYKDSSAVNSSDPAINISPNINGFLLSALMHANATSQAKFLFDNLWTAMIANDSTSTGASWEYVNAETRGPGLGLFTSLSHPWGGAPTYVLPQFVAGLRPVGAGWEEFVVVPAYDGFDLEWASASVATLFGEISVKWELVGQELVVDIEAPAGTNGKFELPGAKEMKSWSVNGKSGQGGASIPLAAGVSKVIVHLS